jgi:hypothetical protein
MERVKSGAHARATFDEARVGSPIARHGRRVGPLSVLAAVGHEVAAVGATVRRTTVVTWLGFALLMGAAASVGALPLGWFALALQVVGFGLVGLMVVWPESFANSMRTDDAFEVRERDSAAVVTYLPVAVATFALPIYLLAQATLFWRVMREFPGVLAGAGWADAWRLSVDNLLLTELFLDVFDVFGFGLADDPPSLAGRVLVFATRLILSVGFVRVALSLLRAGYYRAHGLGRGSDALAELRSAVEEGDAVRVGHLGRQVRDDATGTIDVLVAGSNGRERPRRSGAMPTVASVGSATGRSPTSTGASCTATRARRRSNRSSRTCATPGRDRPSSRPAVDRWPRRPSRWSPLGVAALVAWAPAPLAFTFGAGSMVTLLWLLASPRAAYEVAMERGVAPYVPLDRLRAPFCGVRR